MWGKLISSHDQIQEGFPQPADKVLLEPSSPISPSPTSTAYQEEEHKEDEGGILYKLERAQDAERKSSQNRDQSLRQISVYLEDQGEGEMEQYLLPTKTLLRYALLMDIVRPTCRRSVCFTKGYGIKLRWGIDTVGFFFPGSKKALSGKPVGAAEFQRTF